MVRLFSLLISNMSLSEGEGGVAMMFELKHKRVSEGERNKKGANLGNICQFERGRKLKRARYEIFGLGGED